MQHLFHQPGRQLIKSAVLFTTIGLFFGCQDLKDIQNIDPLKGVTYKIKYQPSKTLVQGLIVDAKTGEPLTVPVEITITGKDASRVITFEGKATTSFTTNKGDLYIGLQGTVPTPANPAEIKVVANAAGYVPTSQNVVLNKDLNSIFRIKLVKESDPPAGVTVKIDGLQPAANGALTADKTIAVSGSSSTTSVQASIQFPKGVQLTDEKGVPVTSAVKATVATYSVDSPNALAATPIGTKVLLAQNASGQTNVTGSLKPASYISVELDDASGKKVSSFSQPVMLKVGVSSNYISPRTNQAIKVGDKLQVYTYNETTGAIAYEQTVSVEQQGAGLGVTMPVTHFSGRILGDDVPLCGNTTTRVTGLPENFEFQYSIQADGFAPISGVTSVGSTGEATISIPGIPSGTSGSVTLSSPNGEVLYAFKGDLCNTLSSITAKAPTVSSSTVTFSCLVVATCENGKNIQVTTPINVFYGKANTDPANWPSAQINTDGRGTFYGLAPNTNYEIRVYYDGVFVQPFTTTSTNSSTTFEYKLKDNVSVCKK